MVDVLKSTSPTIKSIIIEIKKTLSIKKLLIMKNILTILLVATFAFSCDNDDDDITPFEPFIDMVKIASSPTGFDAYKMDVYMKENPFVGFNYVYVDLYDSVSGDKASDWGVSFAPLMTMMTDMGTMEHTCPIEQPTFDNELKAFAGASVFIMPTTDMGSWAFEIKYENTKGEGSLVINNLTVVEKDDKALLSFVSESNPDMKYFVALIDPVTPDVGINDFELGIYTKESMMSFPDADGLTVEIEPTMPSMGHGSPDNVDPTGMGNGHYKGSVNFTMTGLWQVDLVIEDGEDMITSDQYFVIEF